MGWDKAILIIALLLCIALRNIEERWNGMWIYFRACWNKGKINEFNGRLSSSLVEVTMSKSRFSSSISHFISIRKMIWLLLWSQDFWNFFCQIKNLNFKNARHIKNLRNFISNSVFCFHLHTAFIKFSSIFNILSLNALVASLSSSKSVEEFFFRFSWINHARAYCFNSLK